LQPLEYIATLSLIIDSCALKDLLRKPEHIKFGRGELCPRVGEYVREIYSEEYVQNK